MSHLDEGTIHAWLDGALPPDEAAHVEAHAKECAECAALVAEARGFIAGATRIASSLDVVRGNVIPTAAAKKPATQHSIWKQLKLTPARAAIAATILVGVASMFAVRRQDNSSASLMSRTDSMSPVRAPIAAAAPPAAQSVAPPPMAKSGLNAAPERIAAQRKDPAAKPTVMARSEVARDAAEQPKTVAPAAPSALAGAGVVMSSAGAPPPAASAATATTADVRSAKAAVAEPPINAPTRAANGGAMAPRAFAREQSVAASAEGCYAIDRRPVDPDLHGFPTQFQLTRDSTRDGIVRPMVGPGRFEVPVDGATWQLLPGNSVMITVVNPRGGQMILQFFPGDTLIRMIDGGRPAPIRFAARACGS